jgi:hypothetical protein
MKELLEAIVKALVDNPDQVRIRAIESSSMIISSSSMRAPFLLGPAAELAPLAVLLAAILP